MASCGHEVANGCELEHANLLLGWQVLAPDTPTARAKAEAPEHTAVATRKCFVILWSELWLFDKWCSAYLQQLDQHILLISQCLNVIDKTKEH